PEFFLIETVEPLDLQGCPVIQHDVEYDGRKQVQGEQGGDKLLGPLLARDQLTEDGQYLLQIGRITAVGIDQRFRAGAVHTRTVEVDAQNVVGRTVRRIVRADKEGLASHVQRH